MEYKGFLTTNISKTNIDEETEIYSATVINSADYLAVSASELEDLEPQFHKTINEYLETCKMYKKSPYQGT